MTRDEAREVIARAEALGFVREPTLGGADAYDSFLLADAQEALAWIASEEEAADADAFWADLERRNAEARAEVERGPCSLRGVPAWIVVARGHRSTFAHDLEQERAARWIASGPFA